MFWPLLPFSELVSQHLLLSASSTNVTTHMPFCLPLLHCLLDVTMNIDYFWFWFFFPLPQRTGFRKACQCLAHTNIPQNPAPQNSPAPSPSASHTPQPTLFLPIPLLSGGARNSPLILVSALPFLSGSPWIMPTHFLTESWFPTGNKFQTAKLQGACVLYWKEETYPYSQCKLSLSHSCCDNLHLISEPNQLKKIGLYG